MVELQYKGTKERVKAYDTKGTKYIQMFDVSVGFNIIWV